jgi:hypothetical protein
LKGEKNMQIILHTKPKLLIADEGKKLKSKNDNGEVLENGTIVEPYLTDVIYLGNQITTIEEVENLYEEIESK